jgi:hypothetical protein
VNSVQTTGEFRKIFVRILMPHYAETLGRCRLAWQC